MIPHELVHAVTADLPNKDAFVHEGLAELLIDYLDIPKATRADFERVFATDFDAMVLDFYAEADSLYPMLYEPPIPALESDGEGRWSSALTFDCARTDVLGTEDGLQAVREWVAPVSGHYVVWASTAGEISLRRKTYDVSTALLEHTFSGTEISSGKIEAGTYEIKIDAPAGVEAGVIKIWPLVDGVPVSPGDAP